MYELSSKTNEYSSSLDPATASQGLNEAKYDLSLIDMVVLIANNLHCEFIISFYLKRETLKANTVMSIFLLDTE